MKTEMASRPKPTPEFSHRIGWSSDYGDLFLERFDAIGGAETLLSEAKKHGRVLLHGRGGGAKSVILERLIRKTLADPDAVAILLDLKFWSPADQSRWEALESPQARIDLLFERFSSPHTDTLTLSELPSQVTRLLLVDGLNEVLSATAQQLLTTLDSYVRLAITTRVIVADRLTRREFLSPARWRLAALLPLDEAQVRAVIAKEFGSTHPFDSAPPTTHALLTSPYYLNAALREHKLPSLSTDLHRQYFVTHASLSAHELVLVSEAAFQAYVASSSRIFDLTHFKGRTGPGPLQKLHSCGALIVINSQGYFSHHLKHDYLAALHIAGLNDAQWDYKTFTAVTLYASSFDVLAMALELIPAIPRSDIFIRQVYDWNLYGAAYAVAETRRNALRTISLEMETILLSMLAEKRWDWIETTVQRSVDAMQLFPSDQAKVLLATASFADVLHIVSSIPDTSESFLQWRALFTLSATAAVDDSVLALLEDANSLLGWTAANVLKRTALTEYQLTQLRDRLFATASPQIFWRIVHVLGAYAHESNARALFQVLDDRGHHLWVRYGSIRSLVEMAARAEDPTLRRSILEGLSERVYLLRDDVRIVREFRNSILVRPERAPSDWRDGILTVVRKWKMNDPETSRQSEWEQLELQIRLRYRKDD